MGHYRYLLTAVVLFVAAWFLLISAAAGIPDNPADLSDTSGLHPVAIYAVAIQAIGIVAIVLSALGVLVSIKRKNASFGAKLVTFLVSNALLVFASLLGIFVIGSYVLETYLGVVGIALYIAAIGFVASAIPRRAGRQAQ